MPEFRPRVLRTITCQQFWPQDLPAYPEHVHLRATGGAWEVWNELHGSFIKLKPGDWLRVDTPGDVYPLDQGYMADNYEQVESDDDGGD